MPIFFLALIAIVQGITEFLPVSSSAHLIILPWALGMPDQGPVIDVAVHLGTLFAVIVYFWPDAKRALFGLFDLICGRARTPSARLALMLIVATVPAVLFGLVLKLTGLNEAMRSVTLIGWTTLIFAVALWWFDQKGPLVKTSADWSIKDAVIMGLWQALALIPGTSRSGACITAARALGYQRHDAAKLSMLMSIPTIIASASLISLDLAGQNNTALVKDALIAMVLAFMAALLALRLMVRLLQSVSFTPYVIYRIGLGLLLLTLSYSGAFA